MRLRIDEKEKDVRRIREQSQSLTHKHDAEMELVKSQNKHDLETIQEKVSAAMNKKKEVID